MAFLAILLHFSSERGGLDCAALLGVCMMQFMGRLTDVDVVEYAQRPYYFLAKVMGTSEGMGDNESHSQVVFLLNLCKFLNVSLYLDADKSDRGIFGLNVGSGREASFFLVCTWNSEAGMLHADVDSLQLLEPCLWEVKTLDLETKMGANMSVKKLKVDVSHTFYYFCANVRWP